MPDLLSLHGSRRGQTVVICAPGPSLGIVKLADCKRLGTVVLLTWAFRWPTAGERADFWLAVDPEVVAAGSASTAYETAVIARRPTAPYTGSAPLIEWNLGPIDRRNHLMPGMESREFVETGAFAGQSLAKNQERGPSRLLCSGSSLLAAIHFGLILTGGKGRIVLVGADGRIVSGSRRFCELDGAIKQPSDARSRAQLVAANGCLARSYDELIAGLPGLDLVNATPGSSVPAWPFEALL